MLQVMAPLRGSCLKLRALGSLWVATIHMLVKLIPQADSIASKNAPPLYDEFKLLCALNSLT